MKAVHLDPELVRKVLTNPLLSRKEAAKQLGVCTGRLNRERKALGLPGEPRRKRMSYALTRVVPIDVTRLKELLELEGKTLEECAKILRCGMNTVRRRVRQCGIKTQRRGPRAGVGHFHSWKGGRHIDKDGYVLIYSPEHPQASAHKYVPEHRLVMEKKLRRYLRRAEVVHHRDGDPANNAVENLELFSCKADHLRHELTGRPYATSARKLRRARP